MPPATVSLAHRHWICQYTALPFHVNLWNPQVIVQPTAAVRPQGEKDIAPTRQRRLFPILNTRLGSLGKH